MHRAAAISGIFGMISAETSHSVVVLIEGCGVNRGSSMLPITADCKFSSRGMDYSVMSVYATTPAPIDKQNIPRAVSLYFLVKNRHKYDLLHLRSQRKTCRFLNPAGPIGLKQTIKW
ncbi:hypothetical protein PsorP6_010550 [Peronosclerospora sorghi]|uniref:Uncharacterized protein n=1 Tax=Peronosclerospora sorghi TaxID=230839 RepID=A0ACC0VWA8_9STRA|nr:hypothetical protein PsorP6_010550 [Peronosclerospora sorghi]